MNSFNGIGTKFLGFSKVDVDGTCHATKWIIFFYLPIIPLFRAHIKMIGIKRDWSIQTIQYTLISKEPLSMKEVFSTYLYSYLLFPLLLLSPLILCIKEVGDLLGFHIPTTGLLHPSWGDYFILGAIAWVAFVAWKLKKWDKKRGFAKKTYPTNLPQ